MDSTQLILTEAVPKPAQLENLDRTKAFSQKRAEKIAKDFESLLIDKLLNEMKNTIGDWGFEKDGASKQVQGIFWLHLARDIANKGGFGMWEDISRVLTGENRQNLTAESVDENI